MDEQPTNKVNLLNPCPAPDKPELREYSIHMSALPPTFAAEHNVMIQDLLNRWQQQFSLYLQNHQHNDDAAHDLSHFNRVWNTCRTINAAEGCPADELVLLAASYFHDLVSLPKDHPERHTSSRLSAIQTAALLTDTFKDFPTEKIDAVAHAVEAHSFSAAIAPQTIEARILQDADRMEALGAIGIARTFYIAGRLHTQLFHPEDPLAQHRTLNDKLFALDHFQVKLLKLPALMQTASGKAIAQKKAARLVQFMQAIVAENTGIDEPI